MDAMKWESRPELRRPVLVCAFKGWNDAAESATNALEFAGASLDAERFGALDPEEFFDFQMVRPTVRLSEGQTREIEWPEVVFSSAVVQGADHDLIVVLGTEPNLRWRSFTETIVEAAKELEARLVVTLGALLADVPHSRPVHITGIASTPELVERLGFSTARYEGPTGIVGVLHDACARANLPSASLWAPVPHYVATVPSPKATLALLNALEGLVEVEFDVSDLEDESAEYEQRLDEAVASDPEVRAMVERLEQQMDEAEVPFRDIPSGDTIAREFQRFLRQRGKDQN